MDLEELKDTKDDIIHITKSRSLTFLSMVEPTSPIDSYISILPVKFHGGADRSASGSLAKRIKPVENRAVLADVEFLEMSRVGVVLDGLRPNGGEEIDVFIRVKAADVFGSGGKRSVDFHPTVERVVDDEIVGHANSVGLHGVALAVVVISDTWFVEVGHATLNSVGT